MLLREPAERISYSVFRRLPATLNLIFVVLFLIMPAQLVHVLIEIASNTMSIFIVYAVMLLYCVQYIAVRQPFASRIWIDALISVIPPVFLTATIVRSGGNFMLPVIGCCALIASVAIICWRRITKFFSIKAVALVWILFYLVVVTGSYIDPIAFPRLLGSVLILIIALGQIVVGLSLLMVRVKFGAVVLALLLVSLVTTASNIHDLPSIKRNSAELSGDVSEAFILWLKNRGDYQQYKENKRPYPVILVSSEGGGIYAAAHAYAALSAVQKRCPSFSQHVFAAVGVSGGSFGNALFAQDVANSVQNGTLMPCRTSAIQPDMTAFTVDHLSPIMARMLFLEFFDSLIPGQWVSTDRGSILARSMQNSARPGKINIFELALSDSWSPKSALPVLMFVSTDVSSGNRVIFGATGPEGLLQMYPGSDTRNADISVREAVSTSARFPWVTPTARLHVTEDEYQILADGGYFENSGAETIVDLAQTIRQIAERKRNDKELGNVRDDDDSWTKCMLIIEQNFEDEVTWDGCDQHIYLAHYAISSDNGNLIGYSYGDKRNTSQSFLFDPIYTMLSTREGRGKLAIGRSKSFFCGWTLCVGNTATVNDGFFQQTLPLEHLDLPLGWYMSQKAADVIVSIAAPAESCQKGQEDNATGKTVVGTASVVPDSTDESAEKPASDDTLNSIRQSNGCTAAMLAYLFNPTLDPKAFGIRED